MVFPQFCCSPICDEVKTIGEELIRPSGLTNRNPRTLNSHPLFSGEVTEWIQSPPVNLFCTETKNNHVTGVQSTCQRVHLCRDGRSKVIREKLFFLLSLLATFTLQGYNELLHKRGKNVKINFFLNNQREW